MKHHYIIRTEQDKQDFSLSFSKSKINPQKPIVINIDYFYKKNSNQQLRAYWRLIKVCKNFMNNLGNNFTDEEVSTYFKIRSGHYTEVKGVVEQVCNGIDRDCIKIPRSIALDSGTTTKEMKQLIDTILEFGLDNGIEDCYIESQELDELLKYYDDKNRG